jgi:hypothetical protein
MSEIKVPPPAEIAKRLEACRAEAAALKNLLKLSRTAQAVEEARRARQPAPTEEEGRRHA